MLQKSPKLEHLTLRSPRPDDAVKCAGCQNLITRGRWQTSVGGHHHQFTNPLGNHYHIRCYEFATGFLLRGGATEEHTWFVGYAWTAAHCGACHAHLGWQFTGSQTPAPFYGLIKERIVALDGG